MKRQFLSLLLCGLLLHPLHAGVGEGPDEPYKPTAENLAARNVFANNRFGVFLHWGIYSMFAQGEWYLNYGADAKEYAKAASGFYPARFDAKQWVTSIKNAGARYICFTTRHHDGFSMWHTSESNYNIVDATPFGRDVLGELIDECHKQDVKIHLYYSHLDWMRPDYPQGRTGRTTGRDSTQQNWASYYAFMNRQLTELLTRYGKIDAIWFDGWWDHDEDATPFNWQLEEQYALIHRLQPACLIGNNHHQSPFEGEDIQVFERDVPGENEAGLSGQEISTLPLETCQTMNGMWGYKIMDQNYKSMRELVHLLVKTAGMGANLLLNVGPQPNGELPQTAVERLSGIGQWMQKYGSTIYGTQRGDCPAQQWGTTTRRGDTLYVHIINSEGTAIFVPTQAKVKEAVVFESREKIRFTRVTGVQRLFPHF